MSKIGHTCAEVKVQAERSVVLEPDFARQPFLLEDANPWVLEESKDQLYSLEGEDPLPWADPFHVETPGRLSPGKGLARERPGGLVEQVEPGWAGSGRWRCR